MADDFTHRAVLKIMHNNLESFCQCGAPRSMLDFEYCIDTWAAEAVLCRQVIYGVREAKHMKDKISQLESNGLIRYYEGL